MTSWFLHQVNMPSHNVRETAGFLRDVVGLKEGIWIYPETQGELHHDENSIAYFGTGNRGIHVVRPIPIFPRDNGFLHNPTIGGHFALGVDDLASVCKRLEKAGVPFTDAGVYAMSGVHQIYCYDPSFNVIEINQMMQPLPADELAKQDNAADVTLRTVSVPAIGLEASVGFFGDVLGLGAAAMKRGGDAVFADFETENSRVRLTKPSATIAEDTGSLHNPTATACFSIAVPDLNEMRQRLKRFARNLARQISGKAQLA
ncbi:MAG: hypothetical protein GY948_04820 [Alphaproteobacteria bacterium]|nr:hypothetical protein [Alphaproteobacteria bacterium]